MISHIHHINFIVRDLASAVDRYRKVFGLGEFTHDTLEQRGVKTARVKIGDTWLVLIEPTDQTGVPAMHLKQHGEGFFLMSLATESLDSFFSRIEKLNHETLGKEQRTTRQGLADWKVEDLPIEQFFGAQLQLTEELTSTRTHSI